MTTRRQFLAGAGAVAITAALPPIMPKPVAAACSGFVEEARVNTLLWTNPGIWIPAGASADFDFAPWPAWTWRREVTPIMPPRTTT